MIFFSMPVYFVVFFLVFTLAVGIYFSVKKTTFREHAVGNKQFSTATLVASLLATAYGGGGLIRAVESLYALGLYWIIFTFAAVIDYWVTSRLVLRMGPFMNHISVPETMGSVYGKYPRLVAALVAILHSLVITTGQIVVMSKAIALCFDTDSTDFFTVFSTLIVIFYSAFGGVRAITYTDIFQFITFAIVIPLLAWSMFVKVGKPLSEIFLVLQNHPKFQFSELFGSNTQLISLLMLSLSCMVPYVGPQIIQRIYMASSPNQARKVFACTTLFSIIVRSFILLIGVFVFVAEPSLPKDAVWAHIVAHIPVIFKALFVICLIAMAMSTADSCLNVSSVMLSHDIFEVILRNKNKNEQPVTPTDQLQICRWATICFGLLAMFIAFYHKDLLTLMYWAIDTAVPILSAPFILAVFGFRGTSRTALIGMAAGALSILSWNEWVKPTTGIDGAFISMLANGLAMLAAHYLLQQPENAGWVGPDTDFKQRQQEKARRKIERKEAIKNRWANRKAILAKLQPSHTTIVCIGFYLAITILVKYFIIAIPVNHFCLIIQLFVAACFIGYPFIYDISKTIRAIPTGLGWLIGLGIYFPLNLLWNWFYSVDPVYTISLSCAHFGLMLWSLPLDLAIGLISLILLIAIYPLSIGCSYPLLWSLLPLLLMVLLLFSIIISLKVRQGGYIAQLIYLKNKEQISSSQQLKSSLYDATLFPSKEAYTDKDYGSILKQVVRKVEESISFLNRDTPLFKEDFQSIINKLYDWILYFNRSAQAKNHALLQPTKITLDKLMRKVEVALSQEVDNPPRLFLEKISSANGELSSYIVSDTYQVVYLLVKAALRVGRTEGLNRPIIRIQLHATTLRFKKANGIDKPYPAFLAFPATAFVLSQSTTPSKVLPKVKPSYDEADNIGPKGANYTPPSIDLEQDTIASMVRAHYGYIETATYEDQSIMLLVFPTDVTHIRDKMIVKLPIDCLTADAPVTPQEQADSMMVLMKFHDYIAKYLCKEDPVDIKTISRLLLLVRQHFGFKRHASGQLFYVRSVGIAQIVVDWVFHSPKVIYASLLYELVRHTCLPLSYIKEHYNLGVYAFVSNVLKIDKRESLDYPSLLCIENRLEKALKEDHVQLSVLFIKLAERLYDLRHARGYMQLTEVHHMAQETLAIDVPIANQYLGQEIGKALEVAAQEALKISQTVIIEKV